MHTSLPGVRAQFTHTPSVLPIKAIGFRPALRQAVTTAAFCLCAIPLYASSAHARCESDDECKGDRVCENGKCELPHPAAKAPADSNSTGAPHRAPEPSNASAAAPEPGKDEAKKAEEGPLNTITTAPFALLGGTVSLEYERAVHSAVSFYVAPTFIFGNGIKKSDYSQSGGGIGIGVRTFVTGRAPRGLWLAPDLALSYLSLTGSDVVVTGSAVSLGALLGGTHMGGAFVFSWGIGAAYVATNATGVSTSGASVKVSESGPGLLARLSMGAAF
jgi:hypothetical protein